MKYSHEEKTFENYFNAELASVSSVHFPLGQKQEGIIGADSVAYTNSRRLWGMIGFPWFWFYPPFDGLDLELIASEMEKHTKSNIQNIPKIKTNLLIQYKRTEYLHFHMCREWKYWKQPYFRYEIYQKQQRLLDHINSQFSDKVLTLYAAPAVTNIDELVALSIKKQIIKNTNFQKASKLTGHHINTFIKAGNQSMAFSEPEILNNVDLLETLNTMQGEDFTIESFVSFTSKISTIMEEKSEYKKSFNLLMEQYVSLKKYEIFYGLMQMKVFRELTGIQWMVVFENEKK